MNKNEALRSLYKVNAAAQVLGTGLSLFGLAHVLPRQYDANTTGVTPQAQVRPLDEMPRSNLAPVIFPTPSVGGTDRLPSTESDNQIILRAAGALRVSDDDKAGERNWMRFLPQEGFNTAIIFMDGTRNTLLKGTGESIRTFINPQGTIPIGTESMPQQRPGEPTLSTYSVIVSDQNISFAIQLNSEEINKRSNLDISLEIAKDISFIGKYIEQYNRTPQGLNAAQRREVVNQNPNTAVERNMHGYAQQAQAIIEHVALVGNTNGIDRGRLRDTVHFIEAGQDENSPAWRAFGESKSRLGIGTQI